MKIKKHSYRWPLIVVGILSTHFVLMIVAVTVFVRNYDAGVIPDYYDKAVRWDEIKAARLRSTPASAPAAAESRR